MKSDKKTNASAKTAKAKVGAVYADHLQLCDLAGEDAKGLDGVDGAADGGRVHGQVQPREHVGGWEVPHLRRDGQRLLIDDSIGGE